MSQANAQKRNAPTAKTATALQPLPLTDAHHTGWADALKAQAGLNDATLNQALTVHLRFAQQLEAVNQIRTKRNPHITAPAHLKESRDALAKTVTQAGGRITQQREAIKQRQKELEFDMRQNLGLTKVGENQQMEIRQILRNMKQEERFDAVMQAAERGDAAVLAAIDGQSELVSGIPTDKAQIALQHAFQSHQPELMSLNNTLTQTADLLRKSFDEAFLFLGQADQEGERYLEEARAADEARSMFNNLQAEV